MSGNRSSGAARELGLFVMAFMAMGVAYSIVDSTFNNFLNERFALGGFARSFLEFPRELPGLMVAFVTALLWFLPSRRLASLSMVLGGAGVLLMGFASSSYAFMVLWLFVYSLGQHLFLPLASSIGMELAREGKAGRRLGQLNAIRNLAAIFGSFLVFAGFKFLGLTFRHTFALSAAAFALAAVFLFLMKPDRAQPPELHLKLHREYGLYYFLSVVYGSRKQLFLTFAPWVLVTVFRQPTQTIATLLTLGGVIGIAFQPLLGWAIDRFGERLVLVCEAVLLVFVCSGYGFAREVFTERTAFLIACGCFLLDQMLMSVNMARSTYMKKIAIDPSHVQPALTLSVSIDHVFSIAVALLGGLVWKVAGYQYVFLMGAGIAFLNFLAALRVKVPEPARDEGELPPAVARGR
jgi:predicted MFS family arabinose efflux permease